MFRYFTAFFFVHLTVATILRGRILLNGDSKQSQNLPNESKLLVRLQDTSIADRTADQLAQVEIKNISQFPLDYQIEFSKEKLQSNSIYSLSARITKDDQLLFINDQHVPVIIDSETLLVVDIPVIDLNPVENSQPELRSWPEMIGQNGSYAVTYIKLSTGFTDVFTLFEGSPLTMDFRYDRVRVIVNKQEIVTQIPYIG